MYNISENLRTFFIKGSISTIQEIDGIDHFIEMRKCIPYYNVNGIREIIPRDTVLMALQDAINTLRPTYECTEYTQFVMKYPKLERLLRDYLAMGQECIRWYDLWLMWDNDEGRVCCDAVGWYVLRNDLKIRLPNSYLVENLERLLWMNVWMNKLKDF
jgi:hypothetical protein